MKYKLSNHLDFAMEADQNKVRLIVMEECKEWVCRKERVTELNRFLKLTSGRIFKGRLQLVTEDGNIIVLVKGNIAGSIPRIDFKRGIEEVSQELKK